MTSEITEVLPDGSGRKIVARDKARMKPLHGDGEDMIIRTVDELVLDDGSTVFLCVYPLVGDEEPCTYTSDRAKSVSAHQRTHSGNTRARRLLKELEEAQRIADEAQAELDRRRSAGSERAKKAAKTRNERRRNGVATSGGDTHDTDDADDANGSIDFAALDHTISQLMITTKVIVDDLTGTVESLVDVLETIGEVRRHVKDLPVAGAELVEKAKAYDVIAGALNRR